jgi:hypothetical protein
VNISTGGITPLELRVQAAGEGDEPGQHLP